MEAHPLPFIKMQAVGNDFVVLEESAWPAGTDWGSVAISLCDRKFGVGGDGLLILAPSEIADLRMRMYNPDSTEDMCGNGLRCIIHLARERGMVGTSGTVETLAGVRGFTIHPDGSITTEMGAPRFAPADLPVDMSVFRPKYQRITRVENVPVQAKGTSFWISGVVNTGSTHSVAFVHELPGDEEFFFWSPRVEEDRLFPERTSLMWTQIESPNRLRLRIWERGVGETLGCGTGSCAAAVICRIQGEVAPKGEITVASKGGELRVDWSGKETDSIYLTGKAQTVYTGNWDARP
jgi:diaminopimelate epimerase